MDGSTSPKSVKLNRTCGDEITGSWNRDLQINNENCRHTVGLGLDILLLPHVDRMNLLFFGLCQINARSSADLVWIRSSGSSYINTRGMLMAVKLVRLLPQACRLIRY